MLCQYEEYGKVAEFTGYRGVAFHKVDAYLKSHRKLKSDVDLQFLDADLIATDEHLYFAVLNALQAFKAKSNCSKSVAMESMLYASAQRQISRAIEHIGVKPESCNLAVIVVAEDEKQVETELKALTECFRCSPDATVLQLTEQKIQKIKVAFEISEEEIRTQKTPTEKALVDLVIERMALLSTQF